MIEEKILESELQGLQTQIEMLISKTLPWRDCRSSRVVARTIVQTYVKNLVYRLEELGVYSNGK